MIYQSYNAGLMNLNHYKNERENWTSLISNCGVRILWYKKSFAFYQVREKKICEKEKKRSNNQEVVCSFCISHGMLYLDFEHIGNVVFKRLYFNIYILFLVFVFCFCFFKLCFVFVFVYSCSFWFSIFSFRYCFFWLLFFFFRYFWSWLGKVSGIIRWIIIWWWDHQMCFKWHTAITAFAIAFFCNYQMDMSVDHKMKNKHMCWGQ